MQSRRDQATHTSYAFDAVHGHHAGEELILDRGTFSTLEELAGDDDPDLVTELVELFLEDSMTRMEQIREAAVGGDHESIGRAAHALKSSSANIGALPFSQACAELEGLSRCMPEEDMGALEDLVARAATMYTEVRDALCPRG